MATQTIQIAAPPGAAAPFIKLFDDETDNVAGSEAAAAGVNDSSLYSADFTDAPAARYRVVLFDGATPLASDHVTLTLTTDTFPVEGLQQSVTGSGSGTANEENQLAILAALSGKVIKVSSRTINGNELVSYIGDDDVGSNAQKVIIDDAGEVIKAKLEAAATAIFGAGRENDANQIIGTIDTGNMTHADGRTTIPVEIPAASKPATVDCYEYHIKLLDDDDKGWVEIEGRIDLRPERARP